MVFVSIYAMGVVWSSLNAVRQNRKKITQESGLKMLRVPYN